MLLNCTDDALDIELEHNELEAVLAYPPIARCPSLTKILRYVCELRFAGEERQIREYNIGTQALGRPAEFQPRLDPIVRVEVSRLRKRLAAFYEGEGRTRPVRISVPPGQYVPRFELALKTQAGDEATQLAGCSVRKGKTLAVTDCNAHSVRNPGTDNNGPQWVEQKLHYADTSTKGPVALSSAEADERMELAALLGSQTLRRSPTLLRLAEYMGEAYFSPKAEHIKEYSIAVDALGRPADFDAKQDSIVRVEAYRLRKKLDQYYQTEGRDRALRVVLDPGQYLLRFVKHSVAKEISPELHSTSCWRQAGPAEPRRVVPSRKPFLRLLGALAASLAILAAFYNLVPLSEAHASAGPATIRVMAGAPEIQFAASPLGLTWIGDRWFSGGSTVFGRAAAISLPEAAAHTERSGNFQYAIPLPPGTYELRLYFAPRLRDADTLDPIQTRRFDVFMNGAKIMDAKQAANLQSSTSDWVIRVFRNARPDHDGKLHVVFRNRDDIAYVSGIEIGPGRPDRLMPIRMVAKSSPLTDIQGRVWSFERYVMGGSLVSRSEGLPNKMEDNLFSSERYGDFSYAIPVPPGRYRLRLHFAETWFDPAQGRGGVGSRRFNVYVNGARVLRDFDILRDVGQSYRPVVKEFSGITPSPQGRIDLRFESRVNFACLNALELIDESNRGE